MVQSCFNGFLLLPIAIFLPPLAILIDKGCGNQLFVNCLLTAFFLIPGIINAFLVLYYFENSNDYKKDNTYQKVNTDEEIYRKCKTYNNKNITIV